MKTTPFHHTAEESNLTQEGYISVINVGNAENSLWLARTYLCYENLIWFYVSGPRRDSCRHTHHIAVSRMRVVTWLDFSAEVVWACLQRSAYNRYGLNYQAYGISLNGLFYTWYKGRGFHYYPRSCIVEAPLSNLGSWLWTGNIQETRTLWNTFV